MKLDGDFRLIVTGNTLDVQQGIHVEGADSLWYRLERVLTGKSMDVGATNMQPWGLQIEDDSAGLATD